MAKTEGTYIWVVYKNVFGYISTNSWPFFMIQKPKIREKCAWVRSNTWRDKRPVATGLDRSEPVFFGFSIFRQTLQLATEKIQNLCNCNRWSGLLQLGSVRFRSFLQSSELDLWTLIKTQNHSHLPITFVQLDSIVLKLLLHLVVLLLHGKSFQNQNHQQIFWTFWEKFIQQKDQGLIISALIKAVKCSTAVMPITISIIKWQTICVRNIAILHLEIDLLQIVVMAYNKNGRPYLKWAFNTQVFINLFSLKISSILYIIHLGLQTT